MRKPASREMNFSFRRTVQDRSFLHIQLTETNVLPSKKYARHLLRLILSPQDCQQSLSLGTNPVCNALRHFPHDNVDDSHSCDEEKKSALPVVLSQACPFRLPHEQVCFTDHKISSLPTRTKYRHCRTACEQTVDNSPTDPISS